MRKSLFKNILLTLFVTLSATVVIAQNRYVDAGGTCGGNAPCYTTIQAAIVAANVNDVIQVGDGIYTESILITKSITLQSENGSASTTIQGPSLGIATVRVAANVSSVMLGKTGHGFTIIGTEGTGPVESEQCIC